MSATVSKLEAFYARTEAQIDRRYQSEGFIGGGTVRINGGGSVAMEHLPAILRTLLVTDGTVTKLLEAYFWEPVDVATQQLEVVPLARALPWLAATPGEHALLREVQLRGVHSGRCYATAFSVVRLAVFEADLVQALCEGEIGLGVLIRDSGLESYRELLELLALPATEDETPGVALQMQRTYRIIASGTPAILISECFPCELYGENREP